MSDRIVLHNIQLEGRHGYYDHELATPQPFEVDVELLLNLQPAGIDDDLEKTVDYGARLRGRPADRRVDARSASSRRSPRRSATRS